MPQPKKYKTAAARQRAYRIRHGQTQALSLDELRTGVRELRREIDQKLLEASARHLRRGFPPRRVFKIFELVAHIEKELDRLLIDM